MSKNELVRQAFDDQPLIPVGDYQFLINSLTEQTPATSAELLQAAADWLVEVGNFSAVDLIVGEEDKGAILVAAVSLVTRLPFGLARWVPTGEAGQVAVPFVMEYANGQLYLNGVEPDDRVIIVEDMVSTGGTMLALIQAVQLAGAEIVDIVSVGEKVEYGGVQRIRNETGFTVKTLVKISVAGDRSRVV